MNMRWISISIRSYPLLLQNIQWNIGEISVTYSTHEIFVKYRWNIHENIHWYPMNIIPAYPSGKNSGVSHWSLASGTHANWDFSITWPKMKCPCCASVAMNSSTFQEPPQRMRVWDVTWVPGSFIEKSCVSFTCLSLWSSLGSSRAPGHGNLITSRISSPLFLHFPEKKNVWHKKKHHGRSQWPYDHHNWWLKASASQVSVLCASIRAGS